MMTDEEMVLVLALALGSADQDLGQVPVDLAMEVVVVMGIEGIVEVDVEAVEEEGEVELTVVEAGVLMVSFRSEPFSFHVSR